MKRLGYVACIVAITVFPSFAQQPKHDIREVESGIFTTAAETYSILGYVVEINAWSIKISPRKDGASLPEFNAPGDATAQTPNWLYLTATPCQQGTPVKDLKVGDRVYAKSVMISNGLSAKNSWLVIRKTGKKFRYDYTAKHWLKAPAGDMKKFERCTYE